MAYSCRLTCGHVVKVATLYQNPNQQDERCPIHGGVFLVMNYTRDEWHSRCRDCQHSRSHGMARKYAEQAVVRHMLRNPSHRGYVAFYDKTPSSEIVEFSTAPTLFDIDYDAAPPF